MNLIDMSFGLLEMGLAFTALYFFVRGFSENNGTRANSNALPSIIAGQALIGVAFVARLASLLLRQPRDAFEMIEILILFTAAAGTLIMLAIRYWKCYHRLKGK